MKNSTSIIKIWEKLQRDFRQQNFCDKDFCVTFSKTCLENSLQNFKVKFSGLETKHCLFHYANDKLVIAPGAKGLEYEACSLHYI
jgi:hypothetical protein